MGKAILVAVAVVLVIYAFFDALATPSDRVRGLPKPLWVAVVLLVPAVGALAWILLGTTRLRPNGPRRPRPGPRGPDDDPDYLRGL
ncbi:MAG: PLDc N-terminal domain-containing protein [Aeromicrobium sp.]|uniref:PLDc N-terminal domain-containing protein n=1 Tax=Aeromicrobium sp. TaxID=1871063 RepID=UPI0039E5E715